MRLLYIIHKVINGKIIHSGAAFDRSGVLFAPHKDENNYPIYKIYGVTH